MLCSPLCNFPCDLGQSNYTQSTYETAVLKLYKNVKDVLGSPAEQKTNSHNSTALLQVQGSEFWGSWFEVPGLGFRKVPRCPFVVDKRGLVLLH